MQTHIRHTSAYAQRQHTSAYVSMRPAYVSIRQLSLAVVSIPERCSEPKYGLCLKSRSNSAAAIADDVGLNDVGQYHRLPYVSIRQHTSAQTTLANTTTCHTSAYVSIRQHTSAYVSADDVGQYHSLPYVSIRQQSSAYVSADDVGQYHRLPYVSIRQVRIRQHTSAYVSIRQHTSAYVSIRQHSSAYFRHALKRAANPPVVVIFTCVESLSQKKKK